MVGRPGAGLLPIRGHSNVQGMGTVGVTPKLRDAIFDAARIALRRAASDANRASTRWPAWKRPARANCKFGFCLGGNLYGSNPDAAFAAAAFGKLDLLVYLSTTLNTGHAHGLAQETIILPVLARDEEPQPTTQESMFSYVRLSDGGPRRHDGPRSEIQIVANLGQRVLGGTRAGRLAEHGADGTNPRSDCTDRPWAGADRRNRSHTAGVFYSGPEFPRAAIRDSRWAGAVVCTRAPRVGR